METLKSLIKQCLFLLYLLVLILKCDSIDYRTASVTVIDSWCTIPEDSNTINYRADYDNPLNWQSTVKIIAGSYFDKGLLLKVDEKLNVDDTLFAQYNNYYDVTWICK